MFWIIKHGEPEVCQDFAEELEIGSCWDNADGFWNPDMIFLFSLGWSICIATTKLCCLVFNSNLFKELRWNTFTLRCNLGLVNHSNTLWSPYTSHRLSSNYRTSNGRITHISIVNHGTHHTLRIVVTNAISQTINLHVVIDDRHDGITGAFRTFLLLLRSRRRIVRFEAFTCHLVKYILV